MKAHIMYERMYERLIKDSMESQGEASFATSCVERKACRTAKDRLRPACAVSQGPRHPIQRYVLKSFL